MLVRSAATCRGRGMSIDSRRHQLDEHRQAAGGVAPADHHRPALDSRSSCVDFCEELELQLGVLLEQVRELGHRQR